jgi:hypothetical protein
MFGCPSGSLGGVYGLAVAAAIAGEGAGAAPRPWALAMGATATSADITKKVTMTAAIEKDRSFTSYLLFIA